MGRYKELLQKKRQGKALLDSRDRLILKGSSVGALPPTVTSHRMLLSESPPALGATIGAAVFLFFLLLAACWYYMCYGESCCGWSRSRNRNHSRIAAPQIKRNLSKVFHPRLRSLSMSDLVEATNGFDKERVIGDGGFGLVYKATLPDGQNLAVKRLSLGGIQGKREFEAEMETLGKLHHKSLVELMAYCKAGDDRILVYTLAENGSLDTWLHEREDGPQALGWRRRVHIARACAEGLAFLHHECEPHVIHRDIKSSNILLDRAFEPKIADFGMARFMSYAVSHVSTDAAGTLGYMAPEFTSCLVSTLKTDVYSFGMLLSELGTGRRPNVTVKEKDLRTVVKWVHRYVDEGHPADLLDPVLVDDAPPDEVTKYFRVAYECTHQQPSRRLTMLEVVQLLQLIDEPQQDKPQQDMEAPISKFAL